MEIVQLLIIKFVRLISKINVLMNVHFIGIIIILHFGMIINKILYSKLNMLICTK